MPRLLRILYLPVATYAAFVLLRASGIDVRSDVKGMHSMMGTIFLGWGCGVCYLMSVLPNWEGLRHGRIASPFWLLSTILFAVLIADAAFGIHEQMIRFNLPEQIVFAGHAALLLYIIARYRRTLGKTFWILIFTFGGLASAAILGDMMPGHEGVVTIAGRTMSFEQACETMSVLLLALAFASEAVRDIAALSAGDRPDP